MNLNSGGFIGPSFEEGPPRRCNKWIATLSNRRGRARSASAAARSLKRGQTTVSIYAGVWPPRAAPFL